MSKVDILIADDEPHVIRALSFVFEKEGYTLETASNGDDALRKIRETIPRMVFLDLIMPTLNGLDAKKVYDVKLSMKGFHDWKVKLKPKAGEFRDEETGYHLIRMARYSRLIAGGIGLDRDEAETIELAAPLHDIGKIGIPDQILLKPAKLDEAEWQIMRRHPLIGHEILKGSASKYVRMGALIALGHHEKFDGTGYPNGLVGDHIPLCARIVAVADVYDALTSPRPYKQAWPAERAFQYLAAQRGRHFDPRLVDAFISLRREITEIQSQWQDPGPAAASS